MNPTKEQMLELSKSLSDDPWYYTYDCPSIHNDDLKPVAEAIFALIESSGEKETDPPYCEPARYELDEAPSPAPLPAEVEEAMERIVQSVANGHTYLSLRSSVEKDEAALSVIRAALAKP